MEPIDEPLDWKDMILKAQATNPTIKYLYDSINEQMAKLNEIKPIHFKNPEKLNGKCQIRGKDFEITFIGRDLSESDDNWTWILNETTGFKSEHKLTVMKYPKLDGYATLVKVGYGHKTVEEINRKKLDDIQYMMNEFASLTELPF